MAKITSNAGSTPIELNVNDSGGDGKTVVLIHGWPLSAESWEPQMASLTGSGYRVVSYDRRGFGASDKPLDGYNYNTLAGDLDAIITAMNLDRVTLVGFSMGGGEVARYIGLYGTEKVRAAVFASAVPPFLLKTEDNPEGGLQKEGVEGMKSALNEDRNGFYAEFSKNFYSVDGELKVEDAVVERWRALAAPGLTKAALECIDAFGLTDFREDLAKVDVPTLVIHGDADAIVPVEVSGQRTAAAIRGSEFVEIVGGPHGVTASHADEFNSALLDFLAK